MDLFIGVVKTILGYLPLWPAESVKGTNEYDNRIRDLCQKLPRLPPSSLPPHWSCDWESWHEKSKFLIQPLYHSLSYADMTMACIYRLPVPIRPIAYDKDSNDHTYIFVADGRYYFYLPGPEQLLRLEEEGLTDDKVVRVGLGERYTMLDEAEDGCERMYYLELVQRRKVLEEPEPKPGNGCEKLEVPQMDMAEGR